MLNFDEAKFLENQRGAVACAEELHGVIEDLVERGSDNLLFVASGGAGILMWPAAALMTTRSNFPTRVEHAAELVTAGSGLLSERSIVVMPSRSGDTPETVEALQYCRNAGATVITLTGTPDSPLGCSGRPQLHQPGGGRQLVGVLLHPVDLHRTVGDERPWGDRQLRRAARGCPPASRGTAARPSRASSRVLAKSPHGSPRLRST